MHGEEPKARLTALLSVTLLDDGLEARRTKFTDEDNVMRGMPYHSGQYLHHHHLLPLWISGLCLCLALLGLLLAHQTLLLAALGAATTLDVPVVHAGKVDLHDGDLLADPLEVLDDLGEVFACARKLGAEQLGRLGERVHEHGVGLGCQWTSGRYAVG